jgi:hypothetical protein
VTTSAQGAAANSRLRNCFHIDVFGRNLARRIKWGLAAVGLTISATRAKAEYRVNVGDVFEIAGIRADFRIVGPSPFPACHTSRFGCSFASFGLAAITGMSGPRWGNGGLQVQGAAPLSFRLSRADLLNSCR